VKASIIAGFVRERCFYTREEAGRFASACVCAGHGT